MNTLTPSAYDPFEEIRANKQIEINASKIQLGSTAEIVAEQIHQAIVKFQSSLPEEDDVAVSLVQFNTSTTILVERIDYIGYTTICFHGTDSTGKPLELLQHISQLNFLLTVVPKPKPEMPRRHIGFGER